MDLIDDIAPNLPVLIAGPTGSGKSALALAVAQRQGGTVVNADALQVYGNWRLLTARPSDDELARAPHALYGHVGPEAAYSVGHWLREVEALLADGIRPIVTGGTGLYFSALTRGLAEVPAIPPEIRAEADARMEAEGHAGLLAELDAATRARVDPLNPVRIQRAWEVLRATGTGLAAFQDRDTHPLLPLGDCTALVLQAPPDWLNPRLERRFDRMLEDGALDEARANLAGWDPKRPSARAIGAPELVAHLRGEIPLAEARSRAITATRQYAKRQRSWFRARMRDWRQIPPG